MKFIRKLSWFLSYLFHPILLTTYLFLLVQAFAPSILSPIPTEGRDDFILIIAISTFLLPTLILFSTQLLLKKKIELKDLLIENSRKRTIPLVFTGAFYFSLTATIFYEIHRIVYVLVLSISVLIIITGLISWFWKISAHAVALAGVAGYLLCMAYFFPGTELFYGIILTTLIAGFTLTARLYLNAHTPLQVLAGAVFGFGWAIITSFLILRLNINIVF